MIASNVGCYDETIVDGKTGRLYPAVDVESLTATIRELLEDESQRRALGTPAAEWVASERTWSKVVEGTTEVYQSLL